MRTRMGAALLMVVGLLVVVAGPGQAATELDLDAPRLEVQLVVQHDELRPVVELVAAHQRRHRSTRLVHPGRRERSDGAHRPQTELGQHRRGRPISAEPLAATLNKESQRVRTDVVACVAVSVPGIAETDDQEVPGHSSSDSPDARAVIAARVSSAVTTAC